jgi:hypothetical protein
LFCVQAGETPIHLACNAGYGDDGGSTREQCLTILLDHGIEDINAISNVRGLRVLRPSCVPLSPLLRSPASHTRCVGRPVSADERGETAGVRRRQENLA